MSDQPNRPDDLSTSDDQTSAGGATRWSPTDRTPTAGSDHQDRQDLVDEDRRDRAGDRPDLVADDRGNLSNEEIRRITSDDRDPDSHDRERSAAMHDDRDVQRRVGPASDAARGEQGEPRDERDGRREVRRDARTDHDEDETSAVLAPTEDDRSRAEEFAAQHDPSGHDVEAGAEFRQPGDWTADEAGGPQVFEGDELVEGPEVSFSGDRAPLEDGERGESSLDEVIDGGYGIGSAAPLASGAMPLGHPVKGWEDTKTYAMPDHPGYGAEPHVWFLDAHAAQLAGFHPAP